MTIESDDDRSALAAVGRIIRETLAEMARQLCPGMTTAEFDAIGGAMLEAEGARSAPRLAYDFPGHTCISVNDEAAHGIPGDRVLRDGDLVNIDVSAERDGYWVDTGGSFPVGPPSEAVADLCAHTRAALRKAVFAAKAGRAHQRHRQSGRRRSPARWLQHHRRPGRPWRRPFYPRGADGGQHLFQRRPPAFA